MIKEFFDFSRLGGDYSALIESVKQVKKCSVCGMGQSEKAISSLNMTGKVLYIASDFSIAKKAYELLEPIYKAHPYSEEVLNIYLPVQLHFTPKIQLCQSHRESAKTKKSPAGNELHPIC